MWFKSLKVGRLRFTPSSSRSSSVRCVWLVPAYSVLASLAPFSVAGFAKVLRVIFDFNYPPGPAYLERVRAIRVFAGLNRFDITSAATP